MKNLRKFYTLLIVLYPLLSMYCIVLPMFPLSDMLLVVMCVLILIVQRGRITIKNADFPVILFAAFIVITLFPQLLSGEKVGVLSTMRYLLYLLMLIIGRDYFDFDKGIKYLGIMTISVSAYVIIQYLSFKILDVILPWKIPYLPVIDKNFVLKAQSPYYKQFYRPTGIFYEPTHYAQYCLIYFCYLLFSKEAMEKGSAKWLGSVMVIAAGIICSGSAMGLLMMVIAFGLVYIRILIRNRISVPQLLIGALLISGAVIVISSPSLSKIITKLIPEKGHNISVSAGYRFNSVVQIFSRDRTVLDILLGSGRGSASSYFTAIFYVIYSHGILGFALYLYVQFAYLKFFKTAFTKYTFWTIFLLSFGSEILVNFGILTYFTLLCTYSQPPSLKYEQMQIKER